MEELLTRVSNFLIIITSVILIIDNIGTIIQHLKLNLFESKKSFTFLNMIFFFYKFVKIQSK